MREMGVFIALFWLFGAGIAVAAPDATSCRADVSASRVAAIDSFFRDEVRRRRLPGAVAAIVGAGCGWPLGDPTRHSDAVMTNLLGDDAKKKVRLKHQDHQDARVDPSPFLLNSRSRRARSACYFGRPCRHAKPPIGPSILVVFVFRFLSTCADVLAHRGSSTGLAATLQT